MAASALMSAFKALPGALGMASAARSLAPGVKQHAPAAMKLARSGISEALPGAAKSIAKGMPSMSGAMTALQKATPHLAALTQKPGLGSALLHGFKALRELRGVTRELSKMGSLGAQSGKPGSGLKVMVGRPQKNWEQATKQNGFHELGGGGNGGGSKGSGSGRQGHGIRIMVGRPEMNWKTATAENGFRELGSRKSQQGGASAALTHGIRVMVGRPQKNWEEATTENGFRELGGRESKGGASSEAKRNGFRIIVGHSKKAHKGAEHEHGGQGGIHIQISFVRNEASSGLASQRVGGLSVSLRAFEIGSQSRKRANSFEDAAPSRKHGSSHAFPELDAQVSRKARHRAQSTPVPGRPKHAAASHGFAEPINSPRKQSGRARAHTF